jgi:nonsense-mediated mRNA decay protein 3
MEEEGKKKKKEKSDNVEEEFEEFLDDVAKDKEMRRNMNLYRNEEAIEKLSKKEFKKKERSRISKAELESRKIIKVF